MISTTWRASNRCSRGLPRSPGVDSTDSDVGRLGEQAVDTLRRAANAGWQAVKHVRKDPDLEPLRVRQDFQMLLMDLAFPNDPFAK